MNQEIGSFIELDLRNTGEYYQGEDNIARLNSARAGIYHACLLMNCKSVYIPFYLCPSVKEFLLKKNIKVKQYFISKDFEPEELNQADGSAILIVNYFGMLSISKIRMLANRCKNVIIDNSAAFYSKPTDGCYTVYSPRKFFGVPDGCYVTGKNANKLTEGYEQDFSSGTSSYLLKRIEYGSSAIYSERMKNEERIAHSGILKMSRLTRSLLNSIDYSGIYKLRQRNFKYASSLFRKINRIDPISFIDNDCIPMVYPLVIEQSDLTDKLNEKKIYTGRWWNKVLSEVPEDTFEAWMSKFMIPIPVDQRYDEQIIKQIHDIVINNTNHLTQI
jgi:hypothetical protein